jgi:hypothetical protein
MSGGFLPVLHTIIPKELQTEGSPASEVRHILGLSGKDSSAAALVLKAHHPEVFDAIELFFNDTRCDYPCISEWLEKVENFLDKPILRIDGNLPGVIAKNSSSSGAFLPSRKARYCTKESKIQPMERWLGKDVAILYSGLRFDELDRAGYSPSNQLRVRHPLIEHGISLGGVYALLEGVDLLPPDFFWPSLYNRTLEKWLDSPNIFGLGQSGFASFLSQHQKRVLFAGRSRANCYFCFNQRLYEFIWLNEAYPELFERACAYEKSSYTWIKGCSLRDLLKRKNKIVDDRANFVLKQIESIAFGRLVNQESDQYDSPSCGLFCGK